MSAPPALAYIYVVLVSHGIFRQYARYPKVLGCLLLLFNMAYNDPHGLIAAAVIVQILVLGMIGARFASHKMQGLRFHVSDYPIIVAGVLSTALAIEQIYCMRLITQGRPGHSLLLLQVISERMGNGHP